MKPPQWAWYGDWAGEHLAADRGLRNLHAAGITSLALSWPVVRRHVLPTNLDAQALVSSLAGHGLSIGYVELAPLDGRDQSTVAQQADDVHLQMQLAQQLGAHLVGIASDHRGPSGFDLVLFALNRLAVRAERLNLRLCLRNARDSALEQLDELHVLFRDVKSPALALCLDNLEFHRAAINPADAVLSFSRRIAAVRLRDEKDGRPCRPGGGIAHVGPTVRALESEGVQAPILIDHVWLADTSRPAPPQDPGARPAK